MVDLNVLVIVTLLKDSALSKRQVNLCHHHVKKQLVCLIHQRSLKQTVKYSRNISDQVDFTLMVDVPSNLEQVNLLSRFQESRNA